MKKLIVVLMILAMAANLAYAGTSVTFSVSCTIPPLPAKSVAKNTAGQQVAQNTQAGSADAGMLQQEEQSQVIAKDGKQTAMLTQTYTAR